jgi:hypothetical protein
MEMFYKAYILDGMRNGKKREPGEEAKSGVAVA